MAAKPLIEFLGGVTRFGKLSVIKEAEAKYYGSHRQRQVLVRCDCGVEKVTGAATLKRGEAKSCGCAKPQRARDLAISRVTHGHTRDRKPTTEYRIWVGMKTRCENPKHAKFQLYGGRGIRVCERWRNSFEAFLADMGKRPSPELTIDRINNDGNYEPSNCRWATHSEQNKNRRR